MIGDVVETETAISKLEQLEPSKQSITAELNDLANLKKFLSESDRAYSQKDYRKVSIESIKNISCIILINY